MEPKYMETNAADSTKRFTDRVSDYSRYRPDYPADAIDWPARRAL